MNYLNVQTIGLACGVGFLGYSLYFDHKRRSAPDYRDKVRARRENQRKAEESEDEIELPPAGDKAAIESFFVKEIEIGEMLIQAGKIDRALIHLSYAVVLCPQPQQLLAYMREVLPPTAYVKLVEKVSEANKKVTEAYET